MTPGQGTGAMNRTGFAAAHPPPAAMPATGGAQPPDPMGEIAGAQQGHEGMAQGGHGAMMGGVAGPYDGMTRAASGGMEGGPLADIMAKIMPTLAGLLSGKHP